MQRRALRFHRRLVDVTVQSAARGSTDPQIADLAYAVHSLPDLLLRWPAMDENGQAVALRRFEAKHPSWAGHFTKILEMGAPPHWQLKWTTPEDQGGEAR